MVTQSEPKIDWKKNLFFIWFSQFLSFAGFSSCMPFIPRVMEEYMGISDQVIRLRYISFYQLGGMISLCAAMMFWGMLADRFGRKLMLLRASFAAAFFYPLLVFAPNVWILILIRFFCSFFSGTYNPAQTLAVTTAPPDRHGFALGVVSTSLWSGYMFGYLIGGYIASRYGYTAAFLSAGGAYLISGLMVLFLVRENFRKVNTERKVSAVRLPLKRMITPAVAGIMVLLLLMSIARRIDEPFLVELVTSVMNGCKEASMDFFFFELRGSAVYFTGIISAAAALGGMISGMLFGWLCDRAVPLKLLLWVILLTALSVYLQLISGSVSSLALSRSLSYFAGGGIMPILQIMLTRITPAELRGTYYGIVGSLSTAGGVICSLLSLFAGQMFGLRGIYMAETVCFLLMIPVLIPAGRAVKKELQQRMFTEKTEE